MKVLKFGGTSVGKPERMHSVAQLISSPDQKLVVLSAVSGTTNSLVAISDKLSKGDKDGGNKAIEDLFGPYADFVKNLYSTPKGVENGNKVIADTKAMMLGVAQKAGFGDKETRLFLAQGELISTQLFHH